MAQITGPYPKFFDECVQKQQRYTRILSVLTEEEMKAYTAFYQSQRPNDQGLQCIENGASAFQRDSPAKHQIQIGNLFCIQGPSTFTVHNIDILLKFVHCEERADIIHRVNKIVDEEESAFVAREEAEEKAVKETTDAVEKMTVCE